MNDMIMYEIGRLVTKPCVRGRCIGGEYGTPSFKPCGNYYYTPLHYSDNGHQAMVVPMVLYVNGPPIGENRLQWLNNTLCGHCLPDHTEIGSTCHSKHRRTPLYCVSRNAIIIAVPCYIECESPMAGMIILTVVIVLSLVTTLHVFAQSKSGLPSIFFYFGIPRLPERFFALLLSCPVIIDMCYSANGEAGVATIIMAGMDRYIQW